MVSWSTLYRSPRLPQLRAQKRRSRASKQTRGQESKHGERGSANKSRQAGSSLSFLSRHAAGSEVRLLFSPPFLSFPFSFVSFFFFFFFSVAAVDGWG